MIIRPGPDGRLGRPARRARAFSASVLTAEKAVLLRLWRLCANATCAWPKGTGQRSLSLRLVANRIGTSAIEKRFHGFPLGEIPWLYRRNHRPVAKLLDKIIPDPEARDRAKLELIKLQGDQEAATIAVQMQAIVVEAQSTDPWTSSARPSFLYMMYTLSLWSIPMGLIAAADPKMAAGIGGGMTAYLRGIPYQTLCFVLHRYPSAPPPPEPGKMKVSRDDARTEFCLRRCPR